jgi:hypothetical protein
MALQRHMDENIIHKKIGSSIGNTNAQLKLVDLCDENNKNVCCNEKVILVIMKFRQKRHIIEIVLICSKKGHTVLFTQLKKSSSKA